MEQMFSQDFLYVLFVEKSSRKIKAQTLTPKKPPQ